MKTKVDYDLLLSELARQGIAQVSCDVLQKVAEGLWYEKWVPDLSRISEQSRMDAGYVLDRLLRFNVLTKEQKLTVLSALEPYKPKEPNGSPTSCKDPLAQLWGARADLNSRFSDLMHLQTRHYTWNKAE